MATKLDRIRAKVLEYDDYSNALEQFLALSDKDRKLALTDDTMRGYLFRASDAGNTVECRTVRALLAPPKTSPKIVITMEGGLIIDVIADQNVEIHVLDYDVDEAEPEHLTRVSGSDCYYQEASVTVNSGRVSRWIEEARLNEGVGAGESAK